MKKKEKCAVCGRTGLVMGTCKLCGTKVCYACIVGTKATCPNCKPETVVFT